MRICFYRIVGGRNIFNKEQWLKEIDFYFDMLEFILDVISTMSSPTKSTTDDVSGSINKERISIRFFVSIE